MAAEKLQAYSDAVAAFEKVRTTIREYGETIQTVANYLNRFPDRMMISDVKVKFVITGDRDFTLKADKWPSAEWLAEVLSDYIKKRENVKLIHASLSDEQKKAVVFPFGI